MRRNTAGFDRLLRIAFGLWLLSLVFFGPKTLFGLVGILPIASGFFGYDPLYDVIGFKTGESA